MPVPTGNRLDNSFAIWISFPSVDSTIGFWEKSIKPFGIDMGGGIDTTTGRNTVLRTKISKKLRDLTPVTGMVAYDPSQLSRIITLAGANQFILLTFPDGTTWSFWGFLDKFEPNELSNTNEDQPTASFTIIPTNQNNQGVTQSVTIVAGTTTTGTTTS